MSDVITLEEIAQMHRCSLRHARERLVRIDGFPARIPGRHRQFPLWPRQEVLAFVTRRPEIATSVKPVKYKLLPPAVNLYRHFDVDGRLLYVGISTASMRRLSEHRTDSAWFWNIATIKVERFDTVAQARLAETAAIKSEGPLFNGTYSQVMVTTTTGEA
jgi:hypothetical protein